MIKGRETKAMRRPHPSDQANETDQTDQIDEIDDINETDQIDEKDQIDQMNQTDEKDETDHNLKLFNAERAIISPRKLQGYILSPVHPVGRFKAAFFEKLGYSVERWEMLEQDLRNQVLLGDDMGLERLECVVLMRDIPEHGLRAGDIGAVVEIYPGGGLEVEFVTGSGKTQALLTLSQNDVRGIASHDMLTTRSLQVVENGRSLAVGRD